AASPVIPSLSAAHNPRSLLRRAPALNFCSSSIANFFSKPSSRLSKVVMALGLRFQPGSLRGSSLALRRPTRAPRYLEKMAKTTPRSAAETAVKLSSKRPDRLCWIGQSDRLPSGPVLVLFLGVPGLHGSSVVGLGP